MKILIKTPDCPSMDAWITEAKDDPPADQIGMYLTHIGVVRKTVLSKKRFIK